MLNYLNLYCEFPGFLRLCSIVLFTGGNTAYWNVPFLGGSSQQWTNKNVCNEPRVCKDVDLCVSIICLTSWLTTECPVRNHISVLPRTDKVIKSLFLSGMHQWIVHQFTTYFPMRFLFFPHFPSLLKAGFEKRSFGVSREATGEQIPADTQKKNSFKRACNTTVNCIKEKNAMIKSEMFVWR